MNEYEYSNIYSSNNQISLLLNIRIFHWTLVINFVFQDYQGQNYAIYLFKVAYLFLSKMLEPFLSFVLEFYHYEIYFFKCMKLEYICKKFTNIRIYSYPNFSLVRIFEYIRIPIFIYSYSNIKYSAKNIRIFEYIRIFATLWVLAQCRPIFGRIFNIRIRIYKNWDTNIFEYSDQ